MCILLLIIRFLNTACTPAQHMAGMALDMAIRYSCSAVSCQKERRCCIKIVRPTRCIGLPASCGQTDLDFLMIDSHANVDVMPLCFPNHFNTVVFVAVMINCPAACCPTSPASSCYGWQEMTHDDDIVCHRFIFGCQIYKMCNLVGDVAWVSSWVIPPSLVMTSV